MARVFICGDSGQTELLDHAAHVLANDGHVVVRGPPDDNGQLKHYTAEERRTLIDDADVAVFTTRHACSREVLEGAVRLRGVVYPVTGVETLDLAAAHELGIIVGHGAVPQNSLGMAESTIMLMLMLFYDVETNIARLRDGHWRKPSPAARQLAGKTIGLVGFGRIARDVAALLASFNVRILTCSPRTPASVTRAIPNVDLETLLRESDLVTLLTGLTAETRALIGTAELRLMKSDALLVNTSRGDIIDEGALVEALRTRSIAGAALDAFAAEPLPADSPLRNLDNVILTPHCVGHTIEGVGAIAPALVANIIHILAGELPPVCKNPEVEVAWRARLARLAA